MFYCCMSNITFQREKVYVFFEDPLYYTDYLYITTRDESKEF